MSVIAAMVLADARFPGGGHAHSGGVEEAVARGLLRDVDDLGTFLSGRLRTAGLVSAAFAAAAAGLAAAHPSASRAPAGPARDAGGAQEPGGRAPVGPATGRAPGGDLAAELGALDAELDARTPSPAQRTASRAQGRAALRAARLSWPSPLLDALGPRPHHALLAGVLVGDPLDAARAVAYLSVSGPASAAVRLLGLDPLAVNALLVALPVDEVAARAAAAPPDDLPAAGSPVLDLMAEAHVVHHRERVRLFVS